MATGTTSGIEDRPGKGILHVAFELDDLRWTLTMGTQMERRPRQRRVPPRHLQPKPPVGRERTDRIADLDPNQARTPYARGLDGCDLMEGCRRGLCAVLSGASSASAGGNLFD
jgi:hypothetical protein